MDVWPITVIGRCGLLRQVIDMIAGLCTDWGGGLRPAYGLDLPGRSRGAGRSREVVWAELRAMARAANLASKQPWRK